MHKYSKKQSNVLVGGLLKIDKEKKEKGENVNYQLKMDEMIKNIQQEEKQPKLLLQSCCAPCSSYVLEYLSKYFQITILYYNPNISDAEEYQKRVNEQKRLISEMPLEGSVEFLEGKYDPQEFFQAVKGLEQLGERSKRCYACYELRLAYTAKMAKQLNYDYFTTTLSISPHKNAEWLNEIGARLAKQEGVDYLFADFKKKNGYKRSIELSEKYHLYRQNFCGCIFSKKEAEVREKRV